MQHDLAQRTHRIWNVAVYVRISESERDKSESDSISNQKRYIHKYIDNDSSLNIFQVYSDDGVGGGSFNRPAFNNMIADIEKEIVDCVVVKDLSRFGREHIQADNYIEIFFPSKKIRFISISESIDSFNNPERMNSIDISFTNLLNGHYLTQVSISTKSSLQIKQKEGKYVGSIAPYGYLKSPHDKHKLIIDEEVKNIIKRIFDRYIQGSSLKAIAGGLNDNNTSAPPTPSSE